MMATNHINDFVHMDDEDTRYWVRQMPPILPHEKTPNFGDLVKNEIPHFLFDLRDRKMFRTDKAGRFWHSDDECSTLATRNVKMNSKSNLYEEIKELLEAEFSMLEADEDAIYFKAKSLQSRLGDNKLKAVSLCLQNEFNLEPKKMLKKEHFLSQNLNTSMYEMHRDFFETVGGGTELEVTLPWQEA